MKWLNSTNAAIISEHIPVRNASYARIGMNAKEKTMNSTRYYRNKRMGICTQCSMRPATNGILCEECAADRKSYRKIFKSPYRDEEWMESTKKKKKPGEITTEDVCIMAAERGITYGVMSAILEGRMKDVPLLTDREQ